MYLITYFRVLINIICLLAGNNSLSLSLSWAIVEGERAGEKSMENFEQRWLDTEILLKERFGKVPDMEGILFLIGVNELGRLPR